MTLRILDHAKVLAFKTTATSAIIESSDSAGFTSTDISYICFFPWYCCFHVFSNLNAPASALCFEFIMMFELFIRLSDLKPQVYSIPSIHIQIIQQISPNNHDTSRSQAKHSNSAATFRPVSLTSFGSYAKSPCGTTAAPMSFPLASAKFASTKAVMALLQWWTMPNTGSLWEHGVAQPNIEGDHFSHGKIRRFFQVTTTWGNGFRMFQDVSGNAKKFESWNSHEIVMICHDVSFAPWLWTRISMIQYDTMCWILRLRWTVASHVLKPTVY